MAQKPNAAIPTMHPDLAVQTVEQHMNMPNAPQVPKWHTARIARFKQTKSYSWIKRMIVFLTGAVFVLLVACPQTALAATSSTDGSILYTLRIFGANMGLPATDPRIIVARLIQDAMGFVGIIAVLMILLSGVTYMLSGGDEEKVNSAKRNFFSTIIGLAIMLSAYSIVAFVLNSLSAAGA